MDSGFKRIPDLPGKFKTKCIPSSSTLYLMEYQNVKTVYSVRVVHITITTVFWPFLNSVAPHKLHDVKIKS